MFPAWSNLCAAGAGCRIQKSQPMDYYFSFGFFKTGKQLLGNSFKIPTHGKGRVCRSRTHLPRALRAHHSPLPPQALGSGWVCGTHTPKSKDEHRK